MLRAVVHLDLNHQLGTDFIQWCDFLIFVQRLSEKLTVFPLTSFAQCHDELELPVVFECGVFI